MEKELERQAHLLRIESLRDRIFEDESAFIDVFRRTYDENPLQFNENYENLIFPKTIHQLNEQVFELFLYDAVTGDNDLPKPETLSDLSFELGGLAIENTVSVEKADKDLQTA